MAIRLKRVYDPPAPSDGYRVLVERLWPRGMTKERAQVDLWMKDAGASHPLRRWFGHDPAKWEEFRKRYFGEIRSQPGVIQALRDVIHAHATVTFLYAAHDPDHNNALALKDFLEETP